MCRRGFGNQSSITTAGRGGEFIHANDYKTSVCGHNANGNCGIHTEKGRKPELFFLKLEFKILSLWIILIKGLIKCIPQSIVKINKV